MSDLGFESKDISDERKTFNPGFQKDVHKTRRMRRRLKRGWKQWGSIVWAWIKKPRTRKEWKQLILKTCGYGSGAIFLFLLITWLTLPDIDDPETLFAAQSTVILDRNGVELYRVFSEEDRTLVELSDISEYVQKATIAIEDERFLERGCFDVIGFGRAVVSQFVPGFVRSGGSTLTQQFAKNALVGSKRTPLRKIRELMLACELESKYDKNELLALYLNWIPYGQNAYGIEQAAKKYFGIAAKELTLEQSAVLAALPQLPSYYNPYGNHVRTSVTEDVYNDIAEGKVEKASDINDDDIFIGLLGQYIGTGAMTVYIGGRTDQVLSNMQKLKMISEEEKLRALGALETIEFKQTREDIRAPHFVLWVKDQVEELLGDIEDENALEKGGFQVTTTLDWRMQEVAEQSMEKRRETLATQYGVNNAALMSITPDTREVMAYVGNDDYFDDEHEGKIDMVQVPRQPGSSFKPFVFARAFEEGYGPGSVVYDVETRIGNDTPQNFDGTFWGLTTMRAALAGSRNIPAAKAFFIAGGEDNILSYVESLGVETPTRLKKEYRKKNPTFDYGWPLSIGAAETPLMEMVQGYATLANGGKIKPIVSILEIKDRSGNIVYKAKEETAQEVIDPRIAALITSILSDVSARPNEYWQAVLSVPGYQAAAKTGTSNKCLERNAQGGCTKRLPESTWTMGYTPNLVTGVWSGNATSEALDAKAESLVTAAPIWKDFMAGAQKFVENPKTAFAIPDGITQPQISTLSGKLPSECTPVENRRSDLFLKEFTPTEPDTGCALVEVDRVTNLLASDACPDDARVMKAFFFPTSELPDRWPLWEQAVQSWAKKGMENYDPLTGTGLIGIPLPLAPTELCNPALTPGRDEVPELTIISPKNDDRVPHPAFDVEIEIDSSAPVREILFEVDGKPIRTETSAVSNVSVRVPRTIDEGGEHTLTITLTNQYFTKATKSVRFRFGESLDRIELESWSGATSE